MRLMLELYLLIYTAAVLTLTLITIKHHGLLAKPPDVQIHEKRVLMEEVMKALHASMCPICGSSDTYVEAVDLWKTNTAVVACNNNKCRQKSLWKLEGHVWHLIAPYRVVPEVPVKLETKKPEITEEIKLEF